MKKIFSALSEMSGMEPAMRALKPANVPATEAKVLAILKAQERAGRPTHGPAIARASDGAISVAAVYTLLDRLSSRGLVTRKTETIRVDELDVGFKRVTYRSVDV